MKKDHWVLLGALAVAAFIISRANAQPAAAARQRTGTVTAGPLLAGGSPESVFGFKSAEHWQDAWVDRPSGAAPGWDES